MCPSHICLSLSSSTWTGATGTGLEPVKYIHSQEQVLPAYVLTNSTKCLVVKRCNLHWLSSFSILCLTADLSIKVM